MLLPPVPSLPPRFSVMLTLLPLIVTISGCGPGRRDVNDAFNARDTGHYEVIGRQAHADGTVVLHVRAQRPEHARTIAEDLAVQNFAFSPKAVRIVVDPAAGGARQVYRWDANGLRPDSSQDTAPAAESGATETPAAH